jgi:lysophospholipase L1-like esterase
MAILIAPVRILYDSSHSDLLKPQSWCTCMTNIQVDTATLAALQTQLHDLQQQHQQLQSQVDQLQGCLDHTSKRSSKPPSSDSPSKKPQHFYRAVAILILNTLIIFACFELAARGVFKMARVMSEPTEQLVGEGNSREKVSYYSSQDWAEKYWYEFRLSRTQQYYPYVGWRRAPFKGETIEIDQNGIRLTPGGDCSAKSFKVFTFGASTMWGTGSPNWGTIPANLQKGLEKLRRGPVCVMNFGESAYVSTQDVIMLLTQLRSGNVPNLVLFYNIEGDIYAAYQSGRAGVIENLDDIAARFEQRREPSTFVGRLRSTYSYSLIDELMGKLTIANPQELNPSKLVSYESMGVDVTELSNLIVQDYLGNYKNVSALAKMYGFDFFFFLPPIVSQGNKPLTPEEQEMKHKMEIETAFYKLCTAVYQTIERESSKYHHLYSMVHIFDRYDSLIWIDQDHVTPIGNQVIAERMLDVIQERSPQVRYSDTN